MNPGSQAPAVVPTGRSGGKVLKARRTTARKTPYDRPTPPQTQPPLMQPESPNWLSGLVFPAKFVADGASKILSSFWNPKSWGTPSSSSSSDSDSEPEEDSGDDGNPSDDVIELNEKGSSSEKSETLHLIEQLLMLEQYSREERDRLIDIINSRVVDDSMRESVDAGPSTIRSRTNNETPNTHSQAIMEAKKWVAEKKVRSGLKSDSDNGIHALKSAITPQTTEGEAGSPIDVAKSYMRTRPPWASPVNHDKSLSPSPLAADLFKERTPYSSGSGFSFSSAKQRGYLSAGTWNIQEEIRRVRSKATEDMLSNHRSMKLASSTLEHDTPKHYLANDKSINAVARDEPINLGTPKSVDEIVNLAADGGTPGFSVLSDTRTAQNDLPTEALPSHSKMPDLEQYQGMDSTKMMDGQDDASNKSHHAIHSDNEQNTRPSSEGKELEKEKDEKMVNDTNQVDKNCYLTTESPVVPLVNNSQDSSNTNDLSLAAKSDGISENRAVTRAARQSRRGKAVGK